MHTHDVRINAMTAVSRIRYILGGGARAVRVQITGAREKNKIKPGRYTYACIRFCEWRAYLSRGRRQWDDSYNTPWFRYRFVCMYMWWYVRGQRVCELSTWRDERTWNAKERKKIAVNTILAKKKQNENFVVPSFPLPTIWLCQPFWVESTLSVYRIN